MYTSIGGSAGSSTRTELAAAIIAMSAHGPIHLASDSKSFFEQALKIVNQPRVGVNKPRRWKMVSDSDLREHFYLAIKARGPNAFWATWVKGLQQKSTYSKKSQRKSTKKAMTRQTKSLTWVLVSMAKTCMTLQLCIIAGMTDIPI